MIKQLDEKWYEGEWLNFLDGGFICKGASTRKFTVLSRKSKTDLGIVRWYPQWRRYCFFPNNGILDPTCLREVAEFMENMTNCHKEKRGWTK